MWCGAWNICQGLVAIDFRFALTEHIQIRSIEDKDCLHDLLGFSAGFYNADRGFNHATVFEMKAQWKVLI